MSSAAPAGASPPRRSPAQSEASRRNGARSCGPVTAAGKARASRNALRHGLCSTRSLAPGEDPEAFTALLADLRREAAPRSRLEALLLERLALTFWKLARCDRLEATLATIEPHCPTGRLFPDPGLPRILSRVPELSLLVRYQGQLGRDLQRLLKLVADPLLDRMAEADEPAREAPAEQDAPDAPAPAEVPAAWPLAEPALAAPRNEPERARPSGAPPGPGLEAELRRAARDDPALAAALLKGLLAKGDLAGFTALAREFRQAGPTPREPTLGPREAPTAAPAASRNEPEPLAPAPTASAPRAAAEPVHPATAHFGANPSGAAFPNEPEPAPSRPANPTAAARDPQNSAPCHGSTTPAAAPLRNEPEPSPAPTAFPPGGPGGPRAPAFPPRTGPTTRPAAGPATPAAPFARAEPPPTPDRLADLRAHLPWSR